MRGNLDKCADCICCEWYETTTKEQALFRIDGQCNKYFPRGYVDRKPPHPKWHNSLACLQFERKEV